MGKKKRAKMAAEQGVSEAPPLFEWYSPPMPSGAFSSVLKGLTAAPFVATSPTSKAAATEIEEKAPSMRQQVYEVIRGQRGGITDEEIARITGLNPSTARPRRVSLVKDGLVVQVGVGITSSGRKAALWATVPANDQG